MGFLSSHDSHQPPRPIDSSAAPTPSSTLTPTTSSDDRHSRQRNQDMLPGFDKDAVRDPVSVSSSSTDASVLPLRPHSRNPSAAGLQIRTDVESASHSHSRGPSLKEPGLTSPPPAIVEENMVDYLSRDEVSPTSSTAPPSQTGALRSTLSATSMHSPFSPGSSMSSPALAALRDITPLPSPLIGSDGSSGTRRRSSSARPSSRDSTSGHDTSPFFINMTTNGSRSRSGTLSASSSIKRKKNAYGSLVTTAMEASQAAAAQKFSDRNHRRNRSISEYVPDPLHNERPRNITLSGTSTSSENSGSEDPSKSLALQREQYLADRRGLTNANSLMTVASLPTPPPSNRSMAESDEDETKDEHVPGQRLTIKYPTGKTKVFQAVRPLGHGTFSKVILCTTEKLTVSKEVKHSNGDVFPDVDEATLNPKKLVAIKIVNHGPAGGADEKRVELGLQRELDIMKEISHPSLIHLRSFDTSGDASSRHTLLVLKYCPGGDLFELASQQREEVLSEPMVRRMFAELVGAVRYLHGMGIVHRDIKLENVLVNVRPNVLAQLKKSGRDAIQSHPHPLVTLTDLGLSRHIPAPPATPLLETRCGSEDYAAPEILLGQPYDGRATDAWALGVLLYALMEGRLPFDPPPNPRGRNASRSRTAHRVARCEWGWWRLGDEDGDWVDEKGVEWEGGRRVVENLLLKVTRGRWGVDKVEQDEWVKGGIVVEGGLQEEELER